MKSVIKVSILYQHDYKPVSSENPTERVAAFVSQKYKTHHQFAVKQVALLEAFFPRSLKLTELVATVSKISN